MIKFARDRRGSVLLIELAIMGGLLIVPLLGGLQWALNMSTVQALQQAAREAGRYYAITRDAAGAKDKAEAILTGSSLSASPARFDKNRDVSISENNGYATLSVTYRQPNFVPGLPRLWGGQPDPSAWTFTESAVFRLEG